tara:strand:+ start:11745 stop:12185 length:441 start_codon:yes stop_codon:yes gene_type:complete
MIRNIKQPEKIDLVIPEIVVDINDDIMRIVRDTRDTMKANSLKSLSAPHIGFQKRISLVDVDLFQDNAGLSGVLVMINPNITDGIGDVYVEESFLSEPDRLVPKMRAYISVVEYTDINGKRNEISAVSDLSAAIQHEIECLEGKVF